MASLREDIDASAAWIAQALQSSGYDADFSTQSLWSIDRAATCDTRCVRQIYPSRTASVLFVLSAAVVVSGFAM
ncbi:MAG TPA: hypothetical protein VHS54_08575, partial [Jatrophihabitans sp.]|nr:hypothetical protein [Jatrophihabitans sp.]